MVFSKTELLTLLSRLENSQASITGISKWIAQRNEHAAESVALWAEQCKRDPAKRLLLFYVANDVMQTTKRTFGQYFIDLFVPEIAKAMGPALKDGPRNMYEKLERMIRVWDERNILSRDQLDAVWATLKSRGENIADFETKAVRQPQGEFHKNAGNSNTTRTQTPENTQDPESEFASSDEETDKRDPPDDSIITMKLVNRSTDIDLEDFMDNQSRILLEAIDNGEFEAITDDLVGEKLERIKYTITEFEKKEGWNQQPESEKSVEKSIPADDKFDTVMVEELLTLNFGTYNHLLEKSLNRMQQAKDRDDKFIGLLADSMDQSAQCADEFKTIADNQKNVRKRVRQIAKTFLAELGNRKKKRMEEDRKREEEANRLREESAKREASMNSGHQRNMSSLASAFLQSMANSKAGGPPADYPPPGPPFQGGHGSYFPPSGGQPAPPAGARLSKSLLDSVSKALAGFDDPPSSSSPPSMYTSGAIPPRNPPPPLGYPPSGYPPQGLPPMGPPPMGPPPSGPPPPGFVGYSFPLPPPGPPPPGLPPHSNGPYGMQYFGNMPQARPPSAPPPLPPPPPGFPPR